MQSPASVLLIDDSPGEQELFRQALLRIGLNVVLYCEQDAEGALNFLNRRQELPGLILLDWHLCQERGDALLKRLRVEPRFTAVPVVAFSTSDHLADRSAAYSNGANGYVVKPDTFDDLVQCVGDICRYWLTRNRTSYAVETTC
jgi:DNA-binding response OmpR family regulator